MSNANEPAYPNQLASPTNDGYLSASGLTKRDLIAAMALQGIGTWLPNADHGPFNWDSREDVCALKARWAVAQADALLAELERTA